MKTINKTIAIMLCLILFINLSGCAKTNQLSFTSYDDGTASVRAKEESYQRNVVIPSKTPEGDTVVYIEDRAFSDQEYCKDMTSVVIPDTVTLIGEKAFYRCPLNGNNTFPDSITTICTEAFRESKLTSFKMPAGVTRIEERCFYNCAFLTEVELHDKIERILSEAFSHCVGLSSIDIPDSVTNINYRAFYFCESLTSIVIPDSVVFLGEEAFAECHELTTVTLPDNLYVPRSCFDGCDKLVSINGMSPDEFFATATFNEYKISYKGVSIEPGMDAEELINELPYDNCDMSYDGSDLESSTECTYSLDDGEWEIYAYREDDNLENKLIISTIYIYSSDYFTPEGISIGCSLDDIKAAYGEPTDIVNGGGNVVVCYEKGKPWLYFTVTDDVVTCIFYRL